MRNPVRNKKGSNSPANGPRKKKETLKAPVWLALNQRPKDTRERRGANVVASPRSSAQGHVKNAPVSVLIFCLFLSFEAIQRNSLAHTGLWRLGCMAAGWIAGVARVRGLPGE